jgi:hypothetical protein
MRAKYEWNKVDWTEQDIVIAEKIGATRERVRQVRQSYGLEPSIYKNRKSLRVWGVIRGMNTDMMTLEQISEKVGRSMKFVKGCLEAEKKGYVVIDGRKGGKYAWGEVDWEKTDREIAIQLGVPNKAVVTNHRRRKGLFKKRELVTVEAEKEKTKWVVGEEIKA